MVYLFMFFYEGRERINDQIGLLVFFPGNPIEPYTMRHTCR
jgi:hypothetical protein